MFHAMVLAALGVALAAAPNTEPVKLASPGFTALNLPTNGAAFFADHFAQQLALRGIQVITPSEIGTLIGVERQRQLMGCSEATGSCMAELANALGVDGIIVGSIGKFDTTYQINIKILNRSARVLSVHSKQVEGDKALLEVLNRLAKTMSGEIFKKLKRVPPPVSDAAPATVATSSAAPETSPPVPESEPSTTSSPVVAAVGVSTAGPSTGARHWAWLPAAGGVVLAGVGTVLFFEAKAEGDLLSGRNSPNGISPLSFTDAQTARSVGQTEQTAALALWGVGGAALVAGGALYLLGGPSAPVQVSAIAGPHGWNAAVAGTFP